MMYGHSAGRWSWPRVSVCFCALTVARLVGVARWRLLFGFCDRRRVAYDMVFALP